MKVDLKERQGVTILSPQGELTTGTGDVALREAVRDTLLAPSRAVVLIDLAAVIRIDSWGIGELVAVYTTVTNRGGRLALVNWPSGLISLLEDTKLTRVFEVFGDEDEAVATLGGD